MHIYHNRSSFDLHINGTIKYEDLVNEIVTLTSIPKDSIVLYSINNKPLDKEEICKNNENMSLIVYEEGKVIENGFNKSGLCTNPECKYFNNVVVESCGFVSCERVFYGCTGKCPGCHNVFEVSKIYLKNCHFSYNVLADGMQPRNSNEFDAKEIIPEDYDVSYGNVEYDFTVQSIGCYVCKSCHLLIEGDHTCERVHRHSICKNCSEE